MNTNGLNKRFPNHLSYVVWRESLESQVNSALPKEKRYGHLAHMRQALRLDCPGFVEWPVPFTTHHLIEFRAVLTQRKLNDQSVAPALAE